MDKVSIDATFDIESAIIEPDGIVYSDYHKGTPLGVTATLRVNMPKRDSNRVWKTLLAMDFSALEQRVLAAMLTTGGLVMLLEDGKLYDQTGAQVEHPRDKLVVIFDEWDKLSKNQRHLRAKKHRTAPKNPQLRKNHWNR
ncbi:hypothetical protein [Pseudomonas phage vB_PaeM_PAO1_Ab17]|uniref:Uncharacterized protein n=2 Tax=Nankokuvirus Ab03 TaxID=1925780 RepID=A0A0A1IWI4_9CAUD|nr:hypothetical protein VC54_gp121 [Pseudomonas phage vB_PaeM_PAO1_Ab03]CEF89195.1 hypothetical protein [Pseudomonas phage vB_PaeM_PAO1_Ab03]CEF89579.1 hypothetical protein [Pseudomonas phage vB_PaeM_PAO1_Ab17]